MPPAGFRPDTPQNCHFPTWETGAPSKDGSADQGTEEVLGKPESADKWKG